MPVNEITPRVFKKFGAAGLSRSPSRSPPQASTRKATASSAAGWRDDAQANEVKLPPRFARQSTLQMCQVTEGSFAPGRLGYIRDKLTKRGRIREEDIEAFLKIF